ncbi:MAG TPA: hypothetical protein VFS48_02250 [Solirubrobacterales bacterium]|nr:hypothetical protein [Solirubrobacterales bacterium]
MSLRIGIVVAYGIAGGILTYAHAHEHVDDGLVLALMGTGVIVGAIVGRWWSFLALLGPLFSLGYLQAIGFRELNHDGIDPLLSAPGIARLFWLALPLLIGISIHTGWRHWEDSRRTAES